MKTSLIKTTAVLAATAMLAGCANIRNDQTRTRVEGGLGGTLTGGGIGALIGGGRGALIGAAVGLIAGLAVGDSVARKKAKYASQEAWLSACIAEAQSVNAHAVSYHNSLSSRIEQLEGQINAAKNSGNKGELRQLRRAVLSLQRETKKENENIAAKVKDHNAVVGQTGSVSLRTKVEELRSTQSLLNQSEVELADLGRRIDL